MTSTLCKFTIISVEWLEHRPKFVKCLSGTNVVIECIKSLTNPLFQKKSLSFLEAESSREDVEVLFQDWLWWIFQYLPFQHVVSQTVSVSF